MATSSAAAAAAATAPSTPTPPTGAQAANGGTSGGRYVRDHYHLSQQSPFTPSGGPPPPPPRPPTPPPIVSHIDLVVSNLSDGFCGGGDAAPITSSAATVSASGRKRHRAGTNSDTSSAGHQTSAATQAPPPPGLESQYGELRRLLHRGLIGTSDEEGGDKRNVSALLMGPRGCGKSLVLERVLNDLRRAGGESDDDNSDDEDGRDHHHYGMGRFFRIVRLNGLLLRGDDVGAAVRDVVRQLSDVAVAEARYRQRVRRKRAAAKKLRSKGKTSTGLGKGSHADNDEDNDDDASDKDDKEDDDYTGSIASDLLRIRRQGFNSNLALLDETLRAARVDSMPVLVVLDELDAFLPTGGAGPAVGLPGGVSSGGASGASGRSRMIGSRGPRGEMAGGGGPASSDRQLLLYHLLDRVADHRTLLSLVAMTSQLSTVGTFEKRVRSRAEGTSKIIYFGRPSSYEDLVNMLSSKFDVSNRIEEDARKGCRRLGDSLKHIMQPAPRRRSIDVNEENEDARVRAMLKRNYQLGKDVRWFCRVLTVALSLLAEDCARSSSPEHNAAGSPKTGDNLGERIDDDSSPQTPSLTSRYILEALMAMGGMVKTEEDSASAITMSSSGRSSLTSASRGGSTATGGAGGGSSSVYGPFDKNGKVFVQAGQDDPRIQELLDLPESQLAVLLSARRILCRDAAEDSSAPKPLTFGRIKREFETFYRGNVGSGLTTNLYEGNLLHFAFLHLMETGLICPAVDHTGGGPLQYYLHHTRTHAAMEPMALAKMPLHVLVDINSELGVLLKDKMLDCSTALREWGMRIN